MRYHIVYEPGFVNYTGSNVGKDKFWLKDVSELLEQPNTNVVTWQLNDLPLTLKFIDLYKKRMSEVIRKHKLGYRDYNFNYIYDVYQSRNEKTILASRVEMNNIIDFLNTYEHSWFTIPEELKLNETDIDDQRIKNLNELHDIFETEMEMLQSRLNEGSIEYEVSDTFWHKLQSVNLIVHFNEKTFVKDDEADDRTTYFTSLKFDVPKEEDYLLELEDYKYFTLVRPKGALTLDFGTVGKDLFTCSVTDDIELVYKDMISQQFELNPWVQFDWFPCSEKEWDDQMVLYNDWIEQNNVANYLDLSQPKFNPGRHQLGHCISHDFSHPEEFVDTIISQTPKINSFFITDDSNQSIL
jgi:hypothetical protein